MIGHGAIDPIPRQRGENITFCDAISLYGLLQDFKLGPYNAEHKITFLYALHDAVIQDRREQSRFVVISFHLAALVQN